MTTKPKDRTTARKICSEHGGRHDALGWFEALYREASGDESIVPWADMVPNPQLCEWHRRTGFDFHGKRCLKIGCGLGDDAEYLAASGGRVVAFDISPSVIGWCQRRFPNSSVNYVTADLFATPSTWLGAFDFVLESYTLQVLPPEMRQKAMRCVADFVAPSGSLLLICRGREESESPGAMPWPLTRRELQSLAGHGLREMSFEDYSDTENPPVRRFRVHYIKNSP
jgi:2-polyprenyl-3-methyl-5-hydroxy-6-metoxy-1,4-benzoquinol methylase